MKLLKSFVLFVMVSLVVGLGFAFNGQGVKENHLLQEENQEKIVQEDFQIAENDSNKQEEEVTHDEQTEKESESSFSESKQSNSKSSPSKSVTTETSQNEPVNHSQSQVQTPTQPSCTPKKFDFSFVRADFSTFDECKSKGDLYIAGGWGYYCDNFTDDCGDTYYMLTLFNETEQQYDYHEIPIP